MVTEKSFEFRPVSISGAACCGSNFPSDAMKKFNSYLSCIVEYFTILLLILRSFLSAKKGREQLKEEMAEVRPDPDISDGLGVADTTHLGESRAFKYSITYATISYVVF